MFFFLAYIHYYLYFCILKLVMVSYILTTTTCVVIEPKHTEICKKNILQPFFTSYRRHKHTFTVLPITVIYVINVQRKIAQSNCSTSHSTHVTIITHNTIIQYVIGIQSGTIWHCQS